MQVKTNHLPSDSLPASIQPNCAVFVKWKKKDCQKGASGTKMSRQTSPKPDLCLWPWRHRCVTRHLIFIYFDVSFGKLQFLFSPNATNIYLLLSLLVVDALALALTLERLVPWLNTSPTLIYLQIRPSSWPMLFCRFIFCCCARWTQLSLSSSCHYLFLRLVLLGLMYFHIHCRRGQSDRPWICLLQPIVYIKTL